MDSCPKELEPFLKAHKIKIKMRDEEMWRMGIYVQYSVSVAVEHNLAGRKAKSKYIEKPLLQEIEKKNTPMTEDEIQKHRELFIAKMKIMQANFELNRNVQGEVEKENI